MLDVCIHPLINGRKEFERLERNHSYRIPFNESFPFFNKLFKINVCGEGLIRAGVYKIYMTKSMRIEEEHQSPPLKVDRNIQKKTKQKAGHNCAGLRNHQEILNLFLHILTSRLTSCSGPSPRTTGRAMGCMGEHPSHGPHLLLSTIF